MYVYRISDIVFRYRLQYHHEKIQRRLAKPQPLTSFIMKRVSKYELLKIIKAINSLHKEAEVLLSRST